MKEKDALDMLRLLQSVETADLVAGLRRHLGHKVASDVTIRGLNFLREHGMNTSDATTRGTCFTVLSENASRAMAYLGMTRGKDENHAFIYQPVTGEADHEHRNPVFGNDIHLLRRGDKYAAAHGLRMILAHDDRPRTMHAEAERTDRDLLPPTVAALLDRNDQRRAAPRQAWRRHNAEARAWDTAYQRITTNLGQTAERSTQRSRSTDADSLEL